MDVRMKLVLFLLMALFSSAFGQQVPCWRGSQCEGCQDNWKGSINGEAICCANCENSGVNIYPNMCTCAPSGSGKSMWKPGYPKDPNGSEASRGNYIDAYSSVVLVAMLINSIF